MKSLENQIEYPKVWLDRCTIMKLNMIQVAEKTASSYSVMNIILSTPIFVGGL